MKHEHLTVDEFLRSNIEGFTRKYLGELADEFLGSKPDPVMSDADYE